MKNSDFFTPQFVPEHCDHSYFTLGVLYEGYEKHGITWQEFRKKYKEARTEEYFKKATYPCLTP